MIKAFTISIKRMELAANRLIKSCIVGEERKINQSNRKLFSRQNDKKSAGRKLGVWDPKLTVMPYLRCLNLVQAPEMQVLMVALMRHVVL